MKLKKLTMALAVAALPAFAAPAQSAVLDAWQLVINGNTYSDIGRLNLVSGSATVEQEVNGLGQVFPGAKFSEAGFIFSISYTEDNVVGAGDSGLPANFASGDRLEMIFTDVSGQVQTVNPDGSFTFDFQSGDFIIQEAVSNELLATGSIVGVGGTLNGTPGISGTNGESITQVKLDSPLLNGFQILDSAGNPVDLANALFEAVTNNEVVSVAGTGPCSFTPTVPGNNCVTFNVNSAGDAFITVPEPGTLALLGVSLIGLGFGALRRKS